MSIERVQCPRITSPCTQKLEFARGQQTAFCGLCQKHVHNLSAMSAAERAQLWLREQSPCIRYVRLMPAAVLVLASAGASGNEDDQSKLAPKELPMETVSVVGGIGAPVEDVFLMSEVEEPWLDEIASSEEAR